MESADCNCSINKTKQGKQLLNKLARLKSGNLHRPGFVIWRPIDIKPKRSFRAFYRSYSDDVVSLVPSLVRASAKPPEVADAVTFGSTWLKSEESWKIYQQGQDAWFKFFTDNISTYKKILPKKMSNIFLTSLFGNASFIFVERKCFIERWKETSKE